MTASTISCTYLYLNDDFPGVAKRDFVPQGGFTGSSHHNQAYEKFQAGTKLCAYDETSKGWATFVYLKTGTQSTGTAIAAGSVCALQVANLTTPYLVTNNSGSTACLLAPVVVALSAMTNTYWGWWWCGGVCPQKLVTALATATSISVTGGITAGEYLVSADSSNVLGLEGYANTAVTPIIGFALAADA